MEYRTHLRYKPNWRVWLAIVLIVLVIGTGGCAARRRSEQVTVQPDQVVAAYVGDLTTSINASGEVQPRQKASLSLGMAGRVVQVRVEVGDEVQAGDPLVELATDDLERAVRNAEQNLAIQEANLAGLIRKAEATEIEAARAAVASAQAQLDDLLAGPSQEDLDQAQAALDSAQAAARAAAERYAAQDVKISAAQSQVDDAQDALGFAQWQYDRLESYWKTKDNAPHSPQAVALANAKINLRVAQARYNLARVEVNDSAYQSALARVAQAKANLAALTEEKTVPIASARARLAQAEAKLAALLEGPSAEQVSIAQAQVEQARLSLLEAQDNLSKAILTAPFAGVVTQIYIEEGELASGVAIDLADHNYLQVTLQVDEVDIGLVALGQPATITLESSLNQVLEGRVTYIAPRSTVLNEVVTYEVHIELAETRLAAQGCAGAAGDCTTPVRLGMTANASLMAEQKENVLLVPNRAIIADREQARYYVNLVNGDQLEQVEVQIGTRNDVVTEIVAGLQEGDAVYIGQVIQGLDLTAGPPSGMR